MQASEFKKDAPGQLVANLDGVATFVPAPLPRSVAWTDSLIGSLSAADRAIARLSGVGEFGGVNSNLLIRPFLKREAVLSSKIEGTHASLSDLLLFEIAEGNEAGVPDVREVHNYVVALDMGLKAMMHRPLSCALIKDLHRQLLKDVRGEERSPGAFRQKQVFIGTSHRIEDARFVPPPWLQVPPLMEAFEQFIASPSSLPPLVRAALVHYQFETIHPFEDGNGRVGRLLITLMLCGSGVLRLPLLYLSAFFERNSQEYYDRLLDVSRSGAWAQWLEFFLRGVSHEATDAIDRIGLLVRLRDDYYKIVRRARRSALSTQLIDHLFQSPLVTIKNVSHLLKLTPAASRGQIDRLIHAGILKEVTGQKRNMGFLAQGIIDALNTDDPKLAPK
jgi:Fic family protein